jgi:hypothetical protein
MDTNQARVIERLREVHLIAFREIERLNLRIAELESQCERPSSKSAVEQLQSNSPFSRHEPLRETLTERQGDLKAVIVHRRHMLL